MEGGVNLLPNFPKGRGRCESFVNHKILLQNHFFKKPASLTENESEKRCYSDTLRLGLGVKKYWILGRGETVERHF